MSWVDIAAWAALRGHEPEPWELDALIALDDAWMTVQMEALDRNGDGSARGAMKKQKGEQS